MLAAPSPWDAERRHVIGRFPGEISCLRCCWSVLELVIAGARGLGVSDFEHMLPGLASALSMYIRVAPDPRQPRR
jgi:hypothetical protein